MGEADLGDECAEAKGGEAERGEERAEWKDSVSDIVADSPRSTRESVKKLNGVKINA